MRRQKSIFIFAIIFIFSTLIICQVWPLLFPCLYRFQRLGILVGKNSFYNLKSGLKQNFTVCAVDDMQTKAVIIFDDGFTSVYETAYPIMQKYDTIANVAVVGDRIGLDDYMDIFELGKLYRDGYGILNHSFTHVQGFALDEKQLKKEYKLCRNKLLTRGFLRGNDIIIAPGGEYVENHLDLLKNSCFKSLRSLGSVYVPYSNKPVDIKVINVYGSRSINEVIKLISEAKNNSQDIMLIFHKISVDESVSDMYVSKQDFCKIIEFLFFEDIETITYEDVLERYGF